jgi:hypothetical protein
VGIEKILGDDYQAKNSACKLAGHYNIVFAEHDICPKSKVSRCQQYPGRKRSAGVHPQLKVLDELGRQR